MLHWKILSPASRTNYKLSVLILKKHHGLTPYPTSGLFIFGIKTARFVLPMAKGNPKAALASALGEYFERLSTNYFFADFF